MNKSPLPAFGRVSNGPDWSAATVRREPRSGYVRAGCGPIAHRRLHRKPVAPVRRHLPGKVERQRCHLVGHGSHGTGRMIVQLLRMFHEDASAETPFENRRWHEDRFCPDSGSGNTVAVANLKPMPYRCRNCRRQFLGQKETVMQSSKIGFHKWASSR